MSADARTLAAALRLARPYVKRAIARWHFRDEFVSQCHHCDEIRKDLDAIDQALEGAPEEE